MTKPTQYDEHFAAAEQKHGLPSGLLKSIAAAESNFNPEAVSPVGAVGLMQFMPQTAKRFNIDPRDPLASIDAAGAYMRKHHDMFKDWSHATAAYNWGEGNVQKMLRGEGKTPPTETVNYVNKVLKPLIGQQGSASPATPATPATPAAPARGADIGIGPQGEMFVNGELIDPRDHGRAIEAYQQGLFTRSGKGQLPQGYRAPYKGEIEGYFKSIVPSSDTGKSLRAGWENYAGGFNEIGGAAQHLMGTPPGLNTGMQAADRNRRYAGAVARENTLPQTWDSAEGAGGVLALTYGKVLESLPYMVEAIGAGLVGAGVRMAATQGARQAAALMGKSAIEQAMARGLAPEIAQRAGEQAVKEAFRAGTNAAQRAAPDIAMLLGTAPSAMGDILGNQRDQMPGEYDVGAAAALTPAYAGLNLLGGGRQAVRAITGEALHGAVGAGRGVAGRAARAATVGVATGAEEAVGEAGQEFINQMGRAAVDPSVVLNDPEALAKYKEAGIIGGLVGGAMGGISGGASRARPLPPIRDDNTPQDILNPPAESAPVAPSAPGVPPVTAPVGATPSALVAQPGNLDYRPEPSPWNTGMRSPLMYSNEAAAMRQTEGTAAPLTTVRPGQAPAVAPNASPNPMAMSPNDPLMLSGAPQSEVAAAGIDAPMLTPGSEGWGMQQANLGQLDEGMVTAKPRKSTTSVVRQRVRRQKLVPGAVDGAPEVTVTPTSGAAELVTARKAKPSKDATLLQGTDRGVQLTSGTVEGADTVVAPERTRGEQIKARAARKAAPATPEVKAEPAKQDSVDDVITDDEAQQITAALSAFSVTKKPRRQPVPAKKNEQAEADADEKSAAKLHEAVAGDSALTSDANSFYENTRLLGGPSNFASQSAEQKKMPASKRERAGVKSGGVDRIAAISKARVETLERIIDRFEALVEKHGVAKVNAMFTYRKRLNLEMEPGLDVEVDEETGAIDDPNIEQAQANAVISNLWRHYRDGNFDTNAWGFSRVGDSIRSRSEDGGNASKLLGWFNGEYKAPWGAKLSGLAGLAVYLRFHGRSDLTHLLGSRLLKIFRETKQKDGFKLIEGNGFRDESGRWMVGMYAVPLGKKPITITTEDGRTIKITKPTVLLSEKYATEEYLLHELIHAATFDVLVRDPGARARLMPIVEAMRKKKPGAKASKDLFIVHHAVTSAPNDLVAAAELLAYGFTNPEFQDYLKTVKMNVPEGGRVKATIRNAFEFFVNLVKLSIGALSVKYSAMERLIEEGARVMDAAEVLPPAAPKRRAALSVLQEYRATNRVTWGDGKEGTVMRVRDRRGLGYDELTVYGTDGEWYKLKSTEVQMARWRGPKQNGFTFGATTAAEGPAHGNFLNPVTAVEKAFKLAFETALPFLYKTDESGRTKIETALQEQGNKLRDHIVSNHPRTAYALTGVIDKFGVPEKFRGLLDMGRKNVHNAGQESMTVWSAMRGFSDEQQALVHEYLQNNGNVDTSKLSDDEKNFLARTKATMQDVMQRAKEQGVLPKGLEGASITEIIQWIDKDTARLAYGLKSTGAFARPKGVEDSAKNVNVLGDASKTEFYRAEIPVADGAPYHIYVPTDMSVEQAEQESGEKIVLDKSRTWRPVERKKTVTNMWTGYTYTEGRARMKATNYTEALVYTMHRLLHDIAANEFANEVVSSSDMDTEGALVYSDKGALIQHVGEYAIIDNPDDPTKKRLARTPGYWTKLGGGYGKLSNKYVPATVYAMIVDTHNNEAMFPEYNKILSFWKTTKTAYSPVTHMNNVLSSFVMAYMNDIPVSSVHAAFKGWLDAIQINKDTGEPINPEADKLWKEFTKSGALVASFGAGDLSNTITDKLRDAVERAHRKTTPDNANSLFKYLHAIEQAKAVVMARNGARKASDLAIKLYEMEDNVFRFAAYTEFKRREMSKPNGLRGDALVHAAGKFAADSMINYSIDARYINNLRKTVLPFLAWPYRAVPMLIKTALFKPWKLATIMSAVYGLNALGYAIAGGDEDDERRLLPEWMQGNLWLMPGVPKAIRLPGHSGGDPLFLNISNFMPLGDFLQESRIGLFGLPWPQALMPGGPMLAAAEIVLGYNSFTGQPISAPTDTPPEKAGNSLKYAWTAFSPNIPLPLNRQGDKVYDLIRNKHGITGDEMDWGTTVLQMVGPKVYAINQQEAAAKLGLQIRGIVRDYRTAMVKAARDEMRYEAPDYDAMHEKQAQLVADMADKLKKLTGEK